MELYDLHYTAEIQAKYEEIFQKTISIQEIAVYLNRLLEEGMVHKVFSETIKNYYSVLNFEDIAKNWLSVRGLH